MMNKNKRTAYLIIFVTIFWTIFIWSMSLRPAEDSSEMSMGIVKLLLDIFLPLAERIIGTVSAEQIEWFHFFVRKCAHFTEYLILGILSWNAFRHYFTVRQLEKAKYRYAWMGAWGYCILAAVLDETIQLFVPGRSGQLRDVVLDGIGALCGVAAAIGIVLYRQSEKQKVHKGI